MPAKKLSKKAFIEELLKGKGVLEIAREYGYKSPSIIYKWRQKDQKFKEQVEKILASPLHAERIRTTQTARTATEETWRDYYFNRYRTTKDRVAAADAAGKTVTFIMNACDPTHKDFDEEFANRNNEEMLREAFQVEDDLKRKAVVENSVQMQKWLIPYLPVVGPKYSRGYENRLQQKKEETNVFVFSNDGIKRAAKLLTTMFGKEEKEVPPLIG